MENDQNWFRTWFNSPYYHLLYEHRDFTEAEKFINNLFHKLDLKAGQKILDLACGKGRHSLSFNQLGLNVTGLDLSPESINEAKKLENPSLNFVIGDMRTFEINESFHAIFNLFTSFGYFKSELDNQIVINNIDKHLDSNGVLVIDYLNAKKVAEKLPIVETINKGHIDFKIKKSIENKFIVKEIKFEDKQDQYSFKEYVKYIDLSEFKSYLSIAGMKINAIYGDYNLNVFDEFISDRLIIVAEKA